MAKLIFWLPDSFMVIGIILIAFGLILGFLTIRRAAALLGLIVLLLVTGPFVNALFDFLWEARPWWVLVLLGFVATMALIRFVIRLLLGSRAADVMIGLLAADGFRWGLRTSSRVAVGLLRLLRPKGPAGTAHY